MKAIDVSTRKFKNTFALVDDEDFDSLSRHKWSASKPQNVIYAIRSVIHGGKRTTVRMHSEILSGTGKAIDHIDGNGLNNTKANLRFCSNSQNLMNIKAGRGTSKLKGVSWHKRSGMWRATIVVNKRQISLGYFHCEQEAGRAYDDAAVFYFGEFASVNGVKK